MEPTTLKCYIRGTHYPCGSIISQRNNYYIALEDTYDAPTIAHISANSRCNIITHSSKWRKLTKPEALALLNQGLADAID